MKIAVVGERFIDRYFVGTSTRTSPEVPTIPVVNITETFDLPGGAGNVTANLKVLGVDVIDSYQSYSYPIKNRLICDGQQIARWDQYDDIRPYTIRQSWLLGRALERGDIAGLIISDYGKGMFNDTKLLKGVIPSRLPVFVDTKHSPEKFFGMSKNLFFFPNQHEAEKYPKLYATQDTIYKRGAAGLNFQQFHIPAYSNSVVSVSGAGDTVLAAFTTRYLQTRDIKMALEFASKAAAVVCGKPYTASATLEEINGIQY